MSEEKKEIEIILDEYDWTCSDGCCYNYGIVTTVNGVEMPAHNTDTETILRQVLEHLGYKVTIKRFDNGEEI
jgi:hypothetical protein